MFTSPTSHLDRMSTPLCPFLTSNLPLDCCQQTGKWPTLHQFTKRDTSTKKRITVKSHNLCCLQNGGVYSTIQYDSFLVRSPRLKPNQFGYLKGKSSLAELLRCYHHQCFTRSSSKASDVIFQIYQKHLTACLTTVYCLSSTDTVLMALCCYGLKTF